MRMVLCGLLLNCMVPVAMGQLTTEALIGQAVSLSNQSYPDIENAIQRFRNNDVQGARVFLEKAKAKHTKLPPPDVMLAKMQAFARNGLAMRALLEVTVVKYPGDPEAYLLLADQAFAAGRTAEASALFEKAESLNGKFEENAKRKRNFVVRSLAGRAAVAERRRQWDQAIDLLQQWVELDPDNASARQRLGIVQFHLEKSSEAFEQFTKARELKPDSLHPDILVGKLLAAEGKNDQARTAFDRAYKEEKSNLVTARAYAEWMIQDGQLNRALEVSFDLLKQEPDSVQVLLLDSVIAIMSGQTERAERGLQKVLSLDPNNVTATNLLAQLLIHQEDKSAQERALSYAQTNAKLYPDNGNVNITLAWVLSRLGRMQEANGALQRGVRSQNLSLDSTYLIAKILSEQNQNGPAIQALSRTIGKGGLFVYRKEAEKLLEELKAKNQ